MDTLSKDWGGRSRPHHTLERMLGRALIPEELARLDGIARETGWSADDGIWDIFYVYEFESDRLSKQIAEIDKVPDSALRKTEDGIRKTVRMVMDDLSKSMVNSFHLELEKSAQRLQDTAARRDMWANSRFAGALMAGLAVFFAVVFNAGYVMGAGKVPFWFQPGSRFEWFCSLVFLVPSGWIVFLGSLPYAGYVLKDSLLALPRNVSRVFSREASLAAAWGLAALILKTGAAVLIFLLAGMFFWAV